MGGTVCGRFGWLVLRVRLRGRTCRGSGFGKRGCSFLWSLEWVGLVWEFVAASGFSSISPDFDDDWSDLNGSESVFVVVMPEAPAPDRFDADEPFGLDLFHRFDPFAFFCLVWGVVAASSFSLTRASAFNEVRCFCHRMRKQP